MRDVKPGSIEGWGGIAVLLLFLTACAGDTTTRATTTIAGICGQLGSSLITARVFKDAKRLTAAEIKTIDTVVDITKPICLPGAVIPDRKTALAIIDSQLTRLIILNGRHGTK